MDGAKPIRENVAGAPYGIGAWARVRQIVDDTASTLFVGLIGRVAYLEYSCGCGQSFPGDPMIGVLFADGRTEEFWQEELEEQPMPTGVSLTAEVHEEIKRRKADGQNGRRIAADLGLNESTVRRAWKRKFVAPGKPGPKKAKAEKPVRPAPVCPTVADSDLERARKILAQCQRGAVEETAAPVDAMPLPCQDTLDAVRREETPLLDYVLHGDSVQQAQERMTGSAVEWPEERDEEPQSKYEIWCRYPGCGRSTHNLCRKCGQAICEDHTLMSSRGWVCHRCFDLIVEAPSASTITNLPPTANPNPAPAAYAVRNEMLPHDPVPIHPAFDLLIHQFHRATLRKFFGLSHEQREALENFLEAVPEDLRPVGLGGVVRTVLTETASLRARVEELEREPEMPEGWALTKPSRIMFSDASGDTSVIDVTLYHALLECRRGYEFCELRIDRSQARYLAHVLRVWADTGELPRPTAEAGAEVEGGS